MCAFVFVGKKNKIITTFMHESHVTLHGCQVTKWHHGNKISQVWKHWPSRWCQIWYVIAFSHLRQFIMSNGLLLNAKNRNIKPNISFCFNIYNYRKCRQHMFNRSTGRTKKHTHCPTPKNIHKIIKLFQQLQNRISWRNFMKWLLRCKRALFSVIKEAKQLLYLWIKGLCALIFYLFNMLINIYHHFSL